MIKTRTFGTSEKLVHHVLELMRSILPTEGNLMLCGGSSPFAIYNQLAVNPCPVHAGRRLFLSDERMVSPDSGKNNAHNLMPMLNALECTDRFIRVDTTLPDAEAAMRYEAALRPMEKVDLGLLGMGTDGHTAGLFTMDQADMKSGPLVLHTDRPDGMRGTSVTPAFFQRVERIILLVPGESKRTIIGTLLNHPETIPAGIALSDHPEVELWTDIPVS